MIESEPNFLSTLKKLVVIVVSAAILFVAVSVLYGMFKSNMGECVLKTKTANPITKCVSLERVESNEALAKGLSGRSELAANNAMLFVFESPGRHCMWMKDMNFSIDMVWLDKNKKITKVARDVSPKTYPKSFCGEKSDKYVIETAAGAVDDEQLKVGTKLDF